MFRLDFKIFKIILLGIASYLLFVALFSNPVADYDLWGYLAFGRTFFERGRIPFQDIFSYAPTKPLWIYHEWLTGVFFYSIYKYTGAAGLQLLRYVIILLTIYLMYLTAGKRSDNPLWSIIAILPATLLISFGYVPVRAQIFTYLFFILTLFILENVRTGSKPSLLWWLLPIQIVWCNLHGGFISGIGLIFLYALGEGIYNPKIFPFIRIGLAALLSTLINPYGIHYWQYIFHSVLMPRPDIGEWTSVVNALKSGIYQIPTYIYLVTSLVCFLFLLLGRKNDKTSVLVLVTTFYLGFAHIRHSVFFGLALGSYLPIILQRLWETFTEKWSLIANRAWLPQAFLVVLMVAFYLFMNPHLLLRHASPSFLLSTPSQYYPIGACKWMINNSIKGNILPQFEWGEFLIWIFYPDCRVGMDGRYETVYQETFSKKYFDFLNGTSRGKDFLNEYSHDIVLIKANTKTDIQLRNNQTWQLAFIDSESALFLKRE